MNVGVEGFNRWSFVNRGDLDGQWQLVDTWDRQGKKLLATFRPHANAYFLYGLLARFTAKHSAVLNCRVEGGREGELRRVFAAAVRSPKGHLTLLVVNDGKADYEVSFHVRRLPASRALYRYRITPAERDRSELAVHPGAAFEVTPAEAGFRDRVPGLSLSVYTTYKLGHDQMGVTAE